MCRLCKISSKISGGGRACCMARDEDASSSGVHKMSKPLGRGCEGSGSLLVPTDLRRLGLSGSSPDPSSFGGSEGVAKAGGVAGGSASPEEGVTDDEERFVSFGVIGVPARSLRGNRRA